MPQENHSEVNPETLERAVFGRYVDDFWDSDIGQYLLKHVLKEYNTALEEFKRCDPTNIARVVQIQSDMKRAEGFRDWLSVAIADGQRALNILQGLDDEPE